MDMETKKNSKNFHPFLIAFFPIIAVYSVNIGLIQLEEFILPGGSELNARLHIARTTCRNSERSLVSLHLEHNKNEIHAKYLNRLSDYLFLLARDIAQSENQNEEHWELEK